MSRRVWVDHRLWAARAAGACDEDRPPGTRLLAGRSEAAAAVSGSGAPRVSTLGTPERQRETEQKGGWVALRSTELLGCTGSPGWR